MILIGFSSVVYGVSLVNVPAAFITAGILILCAFMPMTGKKESPETRSGK